MNYDIIRMLSFDTILMLSNVSVVTRVIVPIWAILAVPMYFLFKFVLKKINVGSDKSRKYLAVIFAIFINPVVILGSLPLYLFMVFTPNFDHDIKIGITATASLITATILVFSFPFYSLSKFVLKKINPDDSRNRKYTITSAVIATAIWPFCWPFLVFMLHILFLSLILIKSYLQ